MNTLAEPITDQQLRLPATAELPEAVPAWLWLEVLARSGKDIDHRMFRTWVAAATYATSATGKDIRPGIELLMDATGYSKNTITAHMQAGVSLGWFHLHAKGGWRGTRNHANIYWLTLPAGIAEADRTHHSDALDDPQIPVSDPQIPIPGSPDPNHGLGTTLPSSPSHLSPAHARASGAGEAAAKMDKREEGAPASPPPGETDRPRRLVTGQPRRAGRGTQEGEDSQPEGPSTGQEDTSQTRAKREAVQEVYQDLIASVAEAYAAQNEMSLTDARRYLASGLNSARNLAARVNYLTSVMEDLAIADDSRLDILEEYARPSSAAPPRGAAPAAAPSQPARAKRGTTYDNRFRFGVAKDGVPYFSRGGKPRRSDEGTVTFTSQDAVEYFQLQKSDKAAWIEFKHELYEKYRAA